MKTALTQKEARKRGWVCPKGLVFLADEFYESHMKRAHPKTGEPEYECIGRPP